MAHSQDNYYYFTDSSVVKVEFTWHGLGWLQINYSQNESSIATTDNVMDYYTFLQYLYILAILARSYQT